MRGQEQRLLPLLRWAGGKQLLLRELMPHVIPDYASRTYREPFLGAGSLYFALKPKRAFLSDANGHLINCYLAVRDHPVVVSKHVRQHAKHDSASHYYATRTAYNSTATLESSAQAGRFIYLNRTCFNGIFRVNRQSHFNVPYGYKSSPVFPSSMHLKKVSSLLATAQLTARSYERALERCAPGDFIYLDPPYPPLNGTSYFTHYTADRFGCDDQEHLAEQVRAAARKGTYFLMTNADTPLIRRLYKTFRIAPLQVTRYITCKSTKHRVGELVITNY
jgi:DNA adenine methylase